jgi:ferredoxin
MIVLDKCVGCGECVPFCPFEAITTYGKAIIDEEKCTECGVCIDYCPISALKNNFM